MKLPEIHDRGISAAGQYMGERQLRFFPASRPTAFRSLREPKRCRRFPVGRIANPSLAEWNQDFNTAAKHHRWCDSSRTGLLGFASVIRGRIGNPSYFQCNYGGNIMSIREVLRCAFYQYFAAAVTAITVGGVAAACFADESRLFHPLAIADYIDGSYASDITFKPDAAPALDGSVVTVANVPFQISQDAQGNWLRDRRWPRNMAHPGGG